MTEPDDVVSRILNATPGHASAIVLGLPWAQSRAVLAALGPREVARLLIAARADRVPDLVESIPPGMLPQALSHLDVVQIASLVPLLPMDAAVRLLQSMPPTARAELLLGLPTHQRRALQEALPPPAVVGGGNGDYGRRVEETVRRVAGRCSWLDQPAGRLLTEIFGRPVQVAARDAPDAALTAPELRSLVTATDWRQVGGLMIITNSPLDQGLGAALRDARAYGYQVEVLQWQDDRDDGVFKRALVRLAG